MRIWIDVANSPHVPCFAALSREFGRRGHAVEFTARAYAQTVELAEGAGLAPSVLGGHGGGRRSGKGLNTLGRAWSLARGARARGFELAVSHNSDSHVLASRALGL